MSPAEKIVELRKIAILSPEREKINQMIERINCGVEKNCNPLSGEGEDKPNDRKDQKWMSVKAIL
jgi:hypothetical protein